MHAWHFVLKDGKQFVSCSSPPLFCCTADVRTICVLLKKKATIVQINATDNGINSISAIALNLTQALTLNRKSTAPHAGWWWRRSECSHAARPQIRYVSWKDQMCVTLEKKKRFSRCCTCRVTGITAWYTRRFLHFYNTIILIFLSIKYRKLWSTNFVISVCQHTTGSDNQPKCDKFLKNELNNLISLCVHYHTFVLSLRVKGLRGKTASLGSRVCEMKSEDVVPWYKS